MYNKSLLSSDGRAFESSRTRPPVAPPPFFCFLECHDGDKYGLAPGLCDTLRKRFRGEAPSVRVLEEGDVGASAAGGAHAGFDSASLLPDAAEIGAMRRRCT